MLLTLPKLSGLPRIDKIIIHSIDQSLYQASIEIEGVEHFIADKKGVLLRTFNMLDMQKYFRGLDYNKMVLRHESAYDEMVGQENKVAGQNILEVPLKDNLLS